MEQFAQSDFICVRQALSIRWRVSGVRGTATQSRPGPTDLESDWTEAEYGEGCSFEIVGNLSSPSVLALILEWAAKSIGSKHDKVSVRGDRSQPFRITVRDLLADQNGAHLRRGLIG